jgi:hypothetical protein
MLYLLFPKTSFLLPLAAERLTSFLFILFLEIATRGRAPDIIPL